MEAKLEFFKDRHLNNRKRMCDAKFDCRGCEIYKAAVADGCDDPIFSCDDYCETHSEKINAIAKNIYGASKVNFTPAAEKALKEITALGADKLPVCVAKTQYSLSDNPSLLGAPKDFEITVRNLSLSNGAGFVVVYTGDIMTMPGLPKVPAAYSIDVDENGKIVGLY